eukprot:CAMPEP_0174364284 /NCGR_PEP_ID=MMETSP0811_2-20130205/72251_1 /TAXON_ID=73025 ORGANISM="Eutreptiella gymnastica-like, Strain CCMP1594" /NCGR_SAMPLE_ID=MMETSP0811_2 /ASSEMBLY_ACC=CAM_ASM_000667 /LENGTH=139 /DNA_ID=CAMNT_0015503769 /DNA_START=50 /DNA_END=466 /DNA_ORIENTATION=-
MPSVVTLLVLGLVLFISVSMATTPEGLKYLEAKALEKGVTKLPSGLLYKVLKEGSPGGKSPEVNSPCDCHYQGTLMDGTVFDSSYKRGQPTTFAPNQVVKCWTEAMQLMKEGDKWELTCPSELAYGESKRGKYITPGAV